MSRFNSVVPVPLGEIRRLDGKLAAAMKPGTLVTAVSNYANTDGKHYHPSGTNATFTANTATNTKGVMIVMEQEELFAVSRRGDGVGGNIHTAFPKDSHARAHVLKAGEEVTVLLATAANIAAGDNLTPIASGKVEKVTDTEPVMFVAIETCSSGADGDDDLRILARVV